MRDHPYVFVFLKGDFINPISYGKQVDPQTCLYNQGPKICFMRNSRIPRNS